MSDKNFAEEAEDFPELNAPDVMKNAFSKLLKTYLDVKSRTPYGTHPELWGAIDRLKGGITRIASYRERPYLRFSWSLGAGNWSNIPWIAFLDTRETTSTEQGVYFALLFREDMSGFYLCLTQGITKLSRELGKTEAYRELEHRAQALRPSLMKLQSSGFVVGPGIDLHATGALGKGYEQATIAYKFYGIESLPSDDEFAADISTLLHSYDQTFASSRDATGEDEEETSSRVWVYAPGDRAAFWNDFYDSGIMAIGWEEMGDLEQYPTLQDHFKAHTDIYKKNTEPRNDSKTTFNFAKEIKPGDRVFVRRGVHEVVGYGIVDGPYEFRTTRSNFNHVRTVKWLVRGEWQSPIRFPLITVSEITDRPEDVETLLKLVGLDEEKNIPPVEPDQRAPFSIDEAMEGLFVSRELFENTLSIWKAKKNLIIQGAPGVGKTFTAKRLAYALMGFKDPSRVGLVQFHQSYSYEDFVQGYRPNGTGFSLRDGVFYEFCQKARKDPDQRYVFIIDEINRGNLSKILGELMMLVEADKRKPEWAVKLAYAENSEEKFYVPENLFVLGLMNTADRSLSVVDYALRRRFAFVEMPPGFAELQFQSFLEGRGISSVAIAIIRTRLGELNDEIEKDRANLGRGFRIGHSFFCDPPELDSSAPDRGVLEREWYGRVIDSEIKPLLEEYWFDSPEKVDSWCERLQW